MVEYAPLPGQAYDPVVGYDRNRKEPVEGVPAPKCSCGEQRHLSKQTNRYAATCLSLECLQSFLGTSRREKRQDGKKVPKIEPSEAIAAQLPGLLARNLRNR